MRAAAASFLLCACSLARLPDASFPCATDADCLTGRCVAGTCRGTAPDSGLTDGGPRDAGPADGGAPDGGAPDGGAPDGGSPDAGDGGALDAGPSLYCNTWACASSGFTAWDGGVDLDALPCAEFDGGQQWFGAVLSPTGFVIGIPKEARYPLRVDPKTLECSLMGKPREDDAGSWSSGVLGPDGLVYAAPYSARRILRIYDPPDGGRVGVVEWGPDLSFGGQPPFFQGSVIDSSGAIWMVSAGVAGAARVTLDGGLQWYAAAGNFWGLGRVEPGGAEFLVTVPTSMPAYIHVADPRRDVFVPAAQQLYAGNPGLRGVHPRFDGTLVSIGVQLDAMAQLRVEADGGVGVALTDAGILQMGFATTGPDGEVWAMPVNGIEVVRVVPGAPTSWPVTFGFSGYSTCAVVAAKEGIIGLPCDQNGSVIRLRFSSGERRTMEQLLSPFFNKL